MVAVVFVLFVAGSDFGGQAVFEIAHQRFEAVEDGDDFFLDGERGNGDKPYAGIQGSCNQNSYGRGLSPSESEHLIKSLADRGKAYWINCACGIDH